MIVYKKKKSEFLEDIDSGEIGEIVSKSVGRSLGIRVGQSEKKSWENSLEYMGQVLAPDEVSPDSLVVNRAFQGHERSGHLRRQDIDRIIENGRIL